MELLGLLQASLAARALRHQVIAANLANVDTPGYARRDVAFPALLAQAWQRRARLETVVTHPAHLAGLPTEPWSPTVYAEPAVYRPDGNGVDPDRELAELVRNSLEYGALTRLASDALGRLRAALHGR